MCTLTWRTDAAGYDVLFNRDERPGRPAGEAPRSGRAEDGTKLLAPRDPQGGGSWAAVNEWGVTLCVLNGWGVAEAPPPESPRSRGELPFLLGAARDTAEAGRFLEGRAWRDFRPFFLVAFSPLGLPSLWQWTGARLIHEPAPPAPITTSGGRRAEWIVSHRSRRYRSLLEGLPAAAQPSLEALLRYHRSTHPDDPAAGVSMHRPEARTVSLTHLRVDREQGHARIRYLDGFPPRIDPRRGVVRELPLAFRGLPTLEGGHPPDPVARETFDVEELLREKRPDLARTLPAPLVRVLDRVTHRARINGAIREMEGLPARAFPAAALRELQVRWRVEGGPIPPPEAKPIFVANHPLGALDGLGMLAWTLDRYPVVRVPANDVLARIPHLRPFLLPLDRFGGRRDGVRRLHGLFAGEAAVLVFPAGRTARREAGEVVDPPWERMAVRMARLHDRPLVPVRIDAANSEHFYGLHRLRQRMGVRWNLEMLLLPDEMFRARGRVIPVRVGPVLGPGELASMGPSDRERAAALHRLCHRLGR